MYFAIPTTKRANLLGKLTLAFLSKHNVEKSDITIFVNTDEDYKQYNELYYDYNIVTGEQGISNIHNFITNYYSESSCIVRLDDDIDDIDYIDDRKFNLLEVLSNGFKRLKDTGKRYFGFYANKWIREQNRLKEYQDGLCYILGCCVGMINDKTLKIPQNVQYKEDVYRCIHFYKNSGMFRHNKIFIKTKYYRKEGGLSLTRTIENERDSALELVKLFPEYLKIRKKNIRYQFIFNRKLSNLSTSHRPIGSSA